MLLSSRLTQGVVFHVLIYVIVVTIVFVGKVSSVHGGHLDDVMTMVMKGMMNLG